MDWQLRDSGKNCERQSRRCSAAEHFLVGLTRVRNEALLLPDPLDYSPGMSMRSSPMTMPAPMTRSRSCARIPRWR